MDKILHFLACSISTVAVSLATSGFGMWPSILCGALFALGLGLGKEYGDSKASGNKWDWWDIVADLAGILAGSGILILGWLD